MRKPFLSKTNRIKRVPECALPRAIHHPMESLEPTQAELQEATLVVEPSFPNDRYEIVRTPQEWHQEHLDFIKNCGYLNSTPEEADELEAAVYFDHAHLRMVFCCTHCLEMMPWKGGHMFSNTHICPKCGGNMTGEQACRAAYLSLLGIRHQDCMLSESEFIEKTHNLDPYDFVQKYMDYVDDYMHQCHRAERRALNLMKHLFGTRVYHQIVNKGETWVKGADGMHYRLFWSRHGNVAVYEHRYKTHAKKAGKDWKPVAAYCGHFGEDYPISDQIIAQICMLKTDPHRYIDQANKVQHEHLSNCGPEYLHKCLMGKIMAIQL